MGEPSLNLFANLATFIALLLLMLLATEAALAVADPPASTKSYKDCIDKPGRLSCKEVRALQKVADTFVLPHHVRISGDFCSAQQSQIINTSISVQCDCGKADSGVCHIISIVSNGEHLHGSIHEAISELAALQKLEFPDSKLSGHIPDKWDNLANLSYLDLSGNQLTGPIPKSLGNLKSLSELYLGGNFLEGSIPLSLGSISTLTALDLGLNKLSGPIPKELGNLINLDYLDLYSNRLSGLLPPELGQLVNLTVLWLDGNSFTGSIPQSFANLKNLVAFAVAGNSLTGQIPSFIGDWTNLQYLYLLGNEFGGALPMKIFNLTNLYSLWVSDLRNEGFKLPDNANLSSLDTLIIRNSSVTGTIPESFWTLQSLSHVDLSYNKLTGGLSDNIPKDKSLKKLYLMRNNLNGSIPDWIDKAVTDAGDLSYNNFSNTEAIRFSNRIKIQPANRESVMKKMDGICDKHRSKYDFFHINCGGNKTYAYGKHYDGDNSTNDFFTSENEKWVYSASGDFVSTTSNRSDYVKNLKCAISVPESDIYENSRLAPVSLTYYGFCLRNGKYNVTLHFAENVYVNDEDYSSQGKRIFDVYIQGERKWHDFAATRSPVLKSSSVTVQNNLIEIHFYWAGKGSIFTPPRLNGPLVSAISVIRQSSRKLSKLQIGIIAATSFIVLLILLIIFWFWLRDRELSVTFIDIEGRKYSIRQIIKGTYNFNEQMKIYDSDYGKVYKAQLSNHVVAVNKIYHQSREIIYEMAKEITTFTSFDHENLVKLYGGYFRDLCLIIYECLEFGPLQNVLFGLVSGLQLTWKEKYRICFGMAEGLNYLHENQVIHTNIKDTNVLLAGTIREENFRVKIFDFWLAKLYKKDNPFMFEGPKEKYSSLAPEFVMLLKSLTPKVDVYGFGLVVLEILSGRKREESRDGEIVYLISTVYELEDQGRLEHDLIDGTPEGFNKRQAKTILNLAMRCIKPAPNVRPPMSEVVMRLREAEDT